MQDQQRAIYHGDQPATKGVAFIYLASGCMVGHPDKARMPLQWDVRPRSLMEEWCVTQEFLELAPERPLRCTIAPQPGDGS